MGISVRNFFRTIWVIFELMFSILLPLAVFAVMMAKVDFGAGDGSGFWAAVFFGCPAIGLLSGLFTDIRNKKVLAASLAANLAALISVFNYRQISVGGLFYLGAFMFGTAIRYLLSKSK